MKAATLQTVMMLVRLMISIHAAREGGDIAIGSEKYIRNISIHAAREGGDLANVIGNSDFGHFNPRRP